MKRRENELATGEPSVMHVVRKLARKTWGPDPDLPSVFFSSFYSLILPSPNHSLFPFPSFLSLRPCMTIFENTDARRWVLGHFGHTKNKDLCLSSGLYPQCSQLSLFTFFAQIRFWTWLTQIRIISIYGLLNCENLSGDVPIASVIAESCMACPSQCGNTLLCRPPQ